MSQQEENGGGVKQGHQLWEFLTAVSGVDDERERARLTATVVPSVVSCDLSGVALVDETGDNWSVVLQRDGRPLEGSRAASVLARLRPITSQAFRKAGTLSSSRAGALLSGLIDELEVGALALVPLMTRRTRLGVLLAGKQATDDFTSDEDLLLRTLAGHTAISLENLRLYRQLQGYADNLEELVQLRTRELRASEEKHRALLEINNALIANLDRESLFAAVAEALAKTMSFDRASLTLLEPGGEMVQVRALAGELLAPDRGGVGTVFRRHDSRIARAIDSRKPVIRRHLDRSGVGDAEEMLLERGLRSYVSVPLLGHERPLGTLNVGSRKSDTYSAADGDFLMEVGQQVALAMENTLAYEEISELKSRLEQENLYLQEEITAQRDFERIVGTSAGIKQVLVAVEDVAPTAANVLITGETGTGKELVAWAVHKLSPRHAKPLITVNCASIPRELFESEFFGHVKGSFTGALRDRAGRFDLADQGTLFLDEVGEIPLDMQSKLLRVLQEGRFERVGAEETRAVDVRLIAASNRDLMSEVEAGRFRRDLYYRLAVFPLEIPPLRQRPEDVPLLAAHFLHQYARDHNVPEPRLTRASVAELQCYDWPGNARELRNVVERAVITCKGGTLSFDLPLARAAVSAGPSARAAALSGRPEVIPEAEMRRREAENIREALRRTNGKIYGAEGAAQLLGIKPTTLSSRINKLGLRDRRGG